jgi:DNA-directed RNA polymerase specialized sigma24 family protein
VRHSRSMSQRRRDDTRRSRSRPWIPRRFERRWALTILQRAIARLRQEFAGAGRTAELEQLEDYLTGSEPRARYQDAAERLGTTEGAVKKMVYRVRRRYGQLLREEIGATVVDPAEIDSELRHLLSAFKP